MDFAERIRKLSEQVANNKEYATSEENTKQYLVLPFIRELGFNDGDPTEVQREYVADWGIKRNEKVDYAIMQDGKAIMLIECKKLGQIQERSAGSQLARYFTSDKDARFGIVTDGETYKFFSDLDRDNRMDETPFFEFRMLGFKEAEVEFLERFTKPFFDLGAIVWQAKRLKTFDAVKNRLSRELADPSEEFANFLVGQIRTDLSEQVDSSLVKDAIREFPLGRSALQIESVMGRPRVDPGSS